MGMEEREKGNEKGGKEKGSREADQLKRAFISLSHFSLTEGESDHEYSDALSAGESYRAVLCDEESVHEREEFARKTNWASEQKV